jgi:hypothetical protein
MISLLLLLAVAAVRPVRAQTTAAISGQVLDPAGGGIGSARVVLENVRTGFRRESITPPDGEFAFNNVPLETYVLLAEKTGFAPDRSTVSLRTNIPVSVAIRLQLATQLESVSVTAMETASLVDPEATGSRTELNMAAIERVPTQIGSRGLESVLVTLPGFAPNANGAVHPRGAHNQMTYVVDGMPISDQLTGSFASSLDPNIIQTIELFTGNIPAEYGNKLSGVANITTKTGIGTDRLFSGSTQVSAAGFDTLSNVTQFTGGAGRFGYFTSFFTLKSNRFLDQVSLDNLYNGGNSERVFARADYQASPRDVLRLSAMAGRSSFGLANLRSQHAAGQRQRQLLRDASAVIGWVHTLSPRATFDSAASYRTSVSQLFPSPGDTPVTAAQARHLSTLTLAARANAVSGSHTLRGGIEYQHFPVSENFTFGITDPRFNDPASGNFIPTLLAHDLSRGGSLFQFSKKRAGNFYTAFVQDAYRWNRFVFSPGLRYDNYRFLVHGNQVQPRVGLAFHLRETGTVLRVSYNRNYQTPPNENLLLSSADEAAVLVPPDIREALGGALIRIRPERQNVYEAGLQQSIWGVASVNAAFYHKNARDMQDNDNFFNTGIIFPTTLKQSRINGAEMRLLVPARKGWSGSLSLTHYHAVVTPPFSGGLFLGSAAVNVLNAGPFVIDHDQKLGLHGILQYLSRRGFWATGGIRYDSGLVSNPSDPEQVRADPDYADLLPYVNLTSDPPRVRPRTVLDFATGYERVREGRRLWDVQFQVQNLTGKVALYNFQSIFVGTRLVQPRTFGIRLRRHW